MVEDSSGMLSGNFTVSRAIVLDPSRLALSTDWSLSHLEGGLRIEARIWRSGVEVTGSPDHARSPDF
jgi:hypothetical protein